MSAHISFPPPFMSWGVLASWVDASEDDFVEYPGELGTIDAFNVYVSPTSVFADDLAEDLPPKKQVIHGPQRKGRGGKIRRW